MGQAKRRTPNTMPTNEQANNASAGLQVPIIVAGSRGSKRSREPKFILHSKYEVRGKQKLESINGKHLVMFVHGYNVTTSQSLQSSNDFFGKMQQAMQEDGKNPADFAYLSFTWPGDVGPLWFGDAQEFAQHSGVALYDLAKDAHAQNPASITLVTHSLGAHVGLRSAAILGERLYSKKSNARYSTIVLLALAVENDVFERPNMLEEYHFPDAPFGTNKLHMVVSRGDGVLKNAFFASEFDKALGYSGPETMHPLKTMSQRVPDVLGSSHSFSFQLHDFSPRSTTIMNPDLHAYHHSDYWTRQPQMDYYINHIAA